MVAWGGGGGMLGEVVQLAGSETHMLALTDEGEGFCFILFYLFYFILFYLI